MSGPLAVVVASLASAWIAVVSDDGVVAEDYYKQGLLINQRLAAMAGERSPDPAATITFQADGEVRVHVEVDSAAAPRWLRLTLERPGGRDVRELALRRAEDGDWIASQFPETPGRWIVKIESDRWRLPVTTIAGQPSQIHLGAIGHPG